MAMAGIWDGFQPERGGVVGPYHDHQLYGSVLLVLLPIPVALALSARETAWRWGATAIAAACAVCLALSQTRSAWAGLLAAALVFAGLWVYRSGQTRRQGRMALFPALLLLAGVALLWTLTSPPDLRGLLARRAATLSTLGTDGSWQGRLTAWRTAVRLVATEPAVGVGLGRYPDAQRSWAHTGPPLKPIERPSLSEEAHSFYLQTTAETGLVGMGLYLAALTAFAAQCLRHLRRTRGQRLGRRDALLIAIVSLMAGQATDALASPSWQFAEASLFFWALLGLGLAAVQREQPETMPSPRRLPLRRAWRLAASGAAALVLASNFLPIGLLTPVEAYTPPTGWTYVANSTTLTGTTSKASVGQTVYYVLTSKFKDAQGRTYTVNVSNDSTAGYSTAIAPGYTASAGIPVSNPSGQNVSYTIPSNVNGKMIAVNGSFTVNGLKVNASPPATLTVNP